MEAFTSSSKSVLHCAKQFPHLITLIMQPRSESGCHSDLSPVSPLFCPETFAATLNLILQQIADLAGDHWNGLGAEWRRHLPNKRVIVVECFLR